MASKPPIQRLESYIAILRRTAEQIAEFERDWCKLGDVDETLHGAYSAISDIAGELDQWADSES